MGSPFRMSEVAQLMLHNPHTVAIGDSQELRKAADRLQVTTDEMADLYTNHSSLERDKVLAIMQEETFLTAKEAQEAGFATEIYSLVDTSKSEEPAEKADYSSVMDIFALERKHPILASIHSTSLQEGTIHGQA